MRPLQTSFSAFDLSTEEQTVGAVFTTVQKAIIQNQIATTAEQILNLQFNPSDPLLFAQSKAILDGALGAYRNLLYISEEAEASVRNENINRK